MHYLMIYDAVEDYMTRRSEFRAEHLKLADEAQKRGELMLAGAWGTRGSAFWFSVDDEKKVKEFAMSDPYVRNGLIISYRILPWATVIGKDALTPLKP